MALIPKETRIDRSDLRIRIENNIKEEVNTYCEWAGIEDIGHFFSEAAKMVFIRDKDWRKVKTSNDPDPTISPSL